MYPQNVIDSLDSINETFFTTINDDPICTLESLLIVVAELNLVLLRLFRVDGQVNREQGLYEIAMKG